LEISGSVLTQPETSKKLRVPLQTEHRKPRWTIEFGSDYCSLGGLFRIQNVIAVEAERGMGL
jgi:hypothetical protein